MVEFFYTIPSNVSDKCRLYCIFVRHLFASSPLWRSSVTTCDVSSSLDVKNPRHRCDEAKECPDD